jgi:hypothetical protein
MLKEPLESSTERRLLRRVEELGGMCWKLIPESGRGIPDRLAILPDGVVWFVELKRPHGKTSRMQELVQGRLRALGCNIATLYGDVDVELWYEDRWHDQDVRRRGGDDR